jgi:hypothetical protein
MAEEKMTLIEQLQNPPRVDGGDLDEDKVVDLMRAAAFALSTVARGDAGCGQGVSKHKIRYCDTCRHARTLMVEDDDGCEWFECHRFPPTMSADGKVGVWPEVSSLDNCGEWSVNDRLAAREGQPRRQCLFCGDAFVPRERGLRADAKFCCKEHRISFHSQRRTAAEQ